MPSGASDGELDLLSALGLTAGEGASAVVDLLADPTVDTTAVRARPRPPLPVGTPAAAGLQNTPRAGAKTMGFATSSHDASMHNPLLDAHPNGSPNLTLVPSGPWAW